MESVFSFIGLSFGRDQEFAPPSDAEVYPSQMKEHHKDDIEKPT